MWGGRSASWRWLDRCLRFLQTVVPTQLLKPVIFPCLSDQSWRTIPVFLTFKWEGILVLTEVGSAVRSPGRAEGRASRGSGTDVTSGRLRDGGARGRRGLSRSALRGPAGVLAGALRVLGRSLGALCPDAPSGVKGVCGGPAGLVSTCWSTRPGLRRSRAVAGGRAGGPRGLAAPSAPLARAPRRPPCFKPPKTEPLPDGQPHS